MPNFFCFNNMSYQFQPEGSNWCWAACLSNMAIGLNSDSSIGKSQCSIVTHYRKYLNQFNPEIDFDSCCNNSITDKCNLRLDDKHLIYIIEKIGFSIYKFNDNSSLNNFDFIVNSLKNNQAPIILKTIVNESAHMVLISGYGTKSNGCNYILISDPDNSKNETYYNHKHYIESNTIEKFWTTKIENTINLEKDKVLEINYNIIKNTLNLDDISSKIEDKELLDPLNYLTTSNIADFSYGRANKSFKINGYNLNKEKFFGCNLDVNRNLILIGSIENVDESKLKNIRFDTNLITKTYFKKFAIHADVKYKSNSLYIKPIKYPKNYKFEKSEYTLIEFLYKLEKIKQFRISSFL